MKTIKLSILCLVIVLFSSCNESQVNMNYHFFTEIELANILINQDSAMNLQTKVKKLKTYDEFISKINSYEEHDTVYFRDEKGDTLHMLSNSSINIQNVPSFSIRTDTKTALGTSLIAIDNLTFNTISFGLIKENSTSFFEEISVIRPNYDYKNGLYYRFAGVTNKTTSDGRYTVSYENYSWKNNIIENCMVFIKYDTSKNESFKIIYSNKHGFLLIKDEQYEIIKI